MRAHREGRPGNDSAVTVWGVGDTGIAGSQSCTPCDDHLRLHTRPQFLLCLHAADNDNSLGGDGRLRTTQVRVVRTEE
jgi:hypothetical protein